MTLLTPPSNIKLKLLLEGTDISIVFKVTGLNERSYEHFFGLI